MNDANPRNSVRTPKSETVSVSYYRQVHAGHYMWPDKCQQKGHDLDTWTVSGALFSLAPPCPVPPDASFSHGFVEKGVQYWVYTKIAPMSPGTCPRCPVIEVVAEAIREGKLQ